MGGAKDTLAQKAHTAACKAKIAEILAMPDTIQKDVETPRE